MPSSAFTTLQECLLQISRVGKKNNNDCLNQVEYFFFNVCNIGSWNTHFSVWRQPTVILGYLNNTT